MKLQNYSLYEWLFGQFLVGQAYQKENQKAIKFNDFYLSLCKLFTTLWQVKSKEK